MSAVTQSTESIRAAISDDLWDRQKRWELRRDTLIDIATKASNAKDVLVRLHAIYLTRNNAAIEASPERVAIQTELQEAWHFAQNELQRMVVIASLACGAGVRTALADFAMVASDLALEIVGGQPEVLMTRSDDFAAKYNAVTKAMRKEIGNDSEPMFLTDVSLGAQVPSPPSQ